MSKKRNKGQMNKQNWCTDRILAQYLVGALVCFWICRRNNYLFQLITCPAIAVLTRVFRDKRTKNLILAFWKATTTPFFALLRIANHLAKMRLPLYWLILIASKTRVENNEVHGTAGSNSGTEDFIEKGKFVPKEEIEGFQPETLKQLSHDGDDVPSKKTKRSTKSGVSNDTLHTDSFVVPCKVPSSYSCMGRCSREWDLGPKVGRLQCFCDSYCETFMDCCADYDKYCSTSNFLLPQGTFLNSSRIAPTVTTALVLESSKLLLTNAPDLSKSSNVTSQLLTPPFRSIIAPPSSRSYKPSAATQQTIPASLSSGLLMEQLGYAPDERWTCIQDGHGNETVGIWMIASCPKQWPADLTKKKCEQSYSLSVENYNDMIPVSDKRGVNYKNRNYTRCTEANASEIVSFELDFTSIVTPPQHFSRAEVLRFLFRYCSRIRWKSTRWKTEEIL